MRGALGLPARRGSITWAAADGATWVIGFMAAVWLRYEFSFPPGVRRVSLLLAVFCGVAHVAVGMLFGPYRVGHKRGSYEELFELARTILITVALAFALVVVWHPAYLPRSGAITGGALATLGMLALRVIVRTIRTRQAWGRSGTDRAIVFGAGDAGRRLIRAALHEGDSGFAPVAFLDDDPRKARLRIDGVPVRGGRDALAKVAAQTQASVLVLAVTHAEPAVKRELTEAAAELGLRTKVLPSLGALLDAGDMVRSLRDIDVADLLGRNPVHLDTQVVDTAIRGKRVLVTGAGGSIGSELCRQLARFGPATLVLLDRDESGLQATQMSLTGNGLLDSDDLVLADIRDADALGGAFARVRPQVVFHAAALKHLPLLERHPLEAWKSNVLGTLNVLEAAAGVGVETFVNISTDKAADPSCVLGYSKRLTERLTAQYARTEPGRFVSVRFGNVLGSRGSVVGAFTAQIERGGPVTVTDPQVRRYFMLIPEACQLVLEAGAIGTDGEVMVLEMGEQVPIVDVARTLIRMSGREDVDIVFTGLREGEKLSEDLFATREDHRPTDHPLVERVGVPPLSAEIVRSRPVTDTAVALEWMRAAAQADREGDTAGLRGGVPAASAPQPDHVTSPGGEA